MTLGNRIRSRREELGLNQIELAPNEFLKDERRAC